MQTNNFINNLIKKIINCSSNKSAALTWSLQRISAVALIPLVSWFIYFTFLLVKKNNTQEIINIFASPFPVVFLSVFIGLGIYHGNMGMREIIEDYIHNNCLKETLIIFCKILSILSIIVGICSLLVLHFESFKLI